MTTKKTIIGDIVSNDFRTAELFKQANIDFCCGGKMSLEDACSEKGIDTDKFINDLETLSQTPDQSGRNFKDWDLGFLCDYIVNTHHKYVQKNLPDLYEYTQKIASVHGDVHSELIEVASLFSEIKNELTPHLEKEEEVLFPAIKEALKSGSQEAKDLIASEIKRMSSEHEFAGGAMDKINQITNRYSLPEGACNTYQVCFKMLAEFYKGYIFFMVVVKNSYCTFIVAFYSKILTA